MYTFIFEDMYTHNFIYIVADDFLSACDDAIVYAISPDFVDMFKN